MLKGINTVFGSGRINERYLINLLHSFKGFLLKIEIPENNKPYPQSIVRILSLLYHYKKVTFAFEIWKFNKIISFYFYVSKKEILNIIKSQFQAIYPDIVFKEPETSFPRLAINSFFTYGKVKQTGMYFCLKEINEFKDDPLVHILEIMAQLEADSIVQIVFKPCHRRNKKVSESAIQKFGNGAKHIPIFKVKINVFVFSNDSENLSDNAEAITNCFTIFNGIHSFLEPKAYSFFIPIFQNPKRTLKKSIKRKITFDKIYLSVNELASMIHIPVNVRTKGIQTSPQSLIPKIPIKDAEGLSIGNVYFKGQKEDEVLLPISDLFKHQYIIGASGFGKTNFMWNQVLQALKHELCVHVIDPHGDLSIDLVESLEREDLNKVVFLDPLKILFSLNPFQLPSYSHEFQREMIIEKIIGEITEMMQKLYGKQYWGPSLNRTFQNAIRVLYKKDDSPTFEDILNIITMKKSEVKEIIEFQRELRMIPHERHDAVINKIDPFVKNKMLNILFSTKKSTVDFNELMQKGKLVIWRIPKGELSETNMSMIGTAIITKLWFYAVSQEKEQRTPLLLVIDEFQNFAGLETLGIIITEGRKYQIGLILAHQQTKQLPLKILGDILGNCATKIIFRISGDDAVMLCKTIDPLHSQELVNILVNLPVGIAVVKFIEHNFPFEVATHPPPLKHFVDWDSLFKAMRERYSLKERIEIDQNLETILEAIFEFEKKGEVPARSNILSYLRDKAFELSGSDLAELIEKAETQSLVKISEIKSQGRPSIVTNLTQKGYEALGKEPLGDSQKAGGDLHKLIVLKKAQQLKEKGLIVIVPEQSGNQEQPDLYAYSQDDPTNPTAYEIEVKAQHPEQVRKNFFKHIEAGRKVIFIVPDDEVKKRVLNILRDKKEDVKIEILSIKEE